MFTKKRNVIFTSAMLVMVMLMGVLSLSAMAAEPASDNTFTFTSSGVTAASAGEGYEIDGSALTITAAGTYTITGSSTEGSVKVKKGVTGVTLVLKDLTLASGTTAPLVVGKTAGVTVYVSGSVTLTDKEDASTEDTNEDFEGAAIKVKSGASLTITGTGTLTADGSACKNGIKGASEATITVSGAKLIVKAAYNGLASDGELIITGGNVSVTAGNDGIKSDPDDDDTVSKGDLTILGGTITVSAGDDAIKALNDVTIGSVGSDGPAITVTKSVEAIEGARVYLNSGSGTLKASDDGVNAATSRSVSEIAIYVNGGTWLIDSDGDGLDAGGDSTANLGGYIYFNGGETVVLGAANNGNGALDFDSGAKYSGGTVLAVATSGMAQTAQGTGVTFNASITKGAEISVLTSDGTEIISATATKTANWIYLASDKITQGDTVTLCVNGKTAATATVGSTNSTPGMGGMGGQMPGMGGKMPGNNEGSSFGTQQPATEDGSSSGTQQPPIDNGSSFGTQQPPMDNGSSFGTQQPPMDNGSAFAGQQPPMDNGSSFGTQQPPMDNGSSFGNQQPATEDGSAFAGQQPPMDNGSSFGTQQPPMDNGSSFGNQQPATEDGSAFAGQQPPMDNGSAFGTQQPGGQMPGMGQQPGMSGETPEPPAGEETPAVETQTAEASDLSEEEVNGIIAWLYKLIDFFKSLLGK